MKCKKAAAFIICSCMVLTGCAGHTKEENTTTTENFVLEHPASTTEKEAEATTEDNTRKNDTESTTQEVRNPREDVLIAIDPGHQGPNVDMSAKEPNAPGSSEMKMKATGGTTGKYTGVPEYQLNLSISLKLRDELVSKGYRIIMTREDNDTAISNMERACLANDNGADISIRIHANGSDDPGTNGALALVGSSSNPYVGHLYDDSYRLADNVLSSYCESTGMKNLGVTANDTMTGINWSQIPVMILEMGFMSNEQDDRNMEDADYQTLMVEGIVNGIENYYGFDKNEEVSSGTDVSEGVIGNGTEDMKLKETVDSLLEYEREKGAVASAYMKNLKTGDYVDLSTAAHRSASIIKLFIAGCVFQNMSMLTQSGNTVESVEALVSKMISESDNEAANTLISMLGNGDDQAGMDRVTAYASGLGNTETKMGRLMLQFDSEGENYTTVTETGAFLEKLYNNEIGGADKIISYMKKQQRTGKLPAGIPKGVVVANKTGELDDVEHDVAIVYGENADYIICVMLSQLPDTSSGRETIKEISKAVYDHWE